MNQAAYRSLNFEWSKAAPMPRYFFDQHVGGQKTEDTRGQLFPSDAAACHRAAQRMPAGLKKAAERSRNTYVATEVTDGNRTLFVVRGTVIVEPR
ncbi:hypothetical protein QA645_07375 [Bradyrhizobium sp. CIAT3101]|uniref:DUF6894 family protein n=1 Tax=Bradyrhizobium sp. CIAT3101 TaxID=439387 RepID=UPI0024B0818A|nr:hypothetical protein [Bradyrhizobium sp. CIAT3101]WFU82552.1 hypothetical protein QA645_07375 [Bradyrhizobium sp. CIAT3101]